MRRVQWISVVLVMCLVISVHAVGVAITSEQVAIRVGVIRALGTCTPLMAERMGFFDGRSIDVSIAIFPDGPTMMQAFAAGQIDVGYGGLVPAAIWFMNGIDLRIIGSANAGGHTILARAGSGIDRVSDLAGKKVAAPSVGSVTDTLLRGWVLDEVAGLSATADLTLIPGIAPADMPSMLCITREVDAVVTWEPFVSQALLSYDGVEVLFDYATEWRALNEGRNYPVNVITVRERFKSDHPDALKAYMDVHRRTVEFMTGIPQEAHQIMAQEFQLPVEVVRGSLTRMDFLLDLDVAACMDIMGFAKRLGYMRDLPHPDELFELGVY